MRRFLLSAAQSGPARLVPAPALGSLIDRGIYSGHGDSHRCGNRTNCLMIVLITNMQIPGAAAAAHTSRPWGFPRAGDVPGC